MHFWNLDKNLMLLRAYWTKIENNPVSISGDVNGMAYPHSMNLIAAIFHNILNISGNTDAISTNGILNSSLDASGLLDAKILKNRSIYSVNNGIYQFIAAIIENIS